MSNQENNSKAQNAMRSTRVLVIGLVAVILVLGLGLLASLPRLLPHTKQQQP